MLALVVRCAVAAKVVCLHGGGGSADLLRAVQINHLLADVPGLECVYPAAPFPNRVWIPDPPNGKSQPTTDPDIDLASRRAIDAVAVDTIGILGWSQGAAMAAAYVAAQPAGRFNFVVLLGGYVPTTHTGVATRIYQAAPIATPALVWLGLDDVVIVPEMSRHLAAQFEAPTIVESPRAGHAAPHRITERYGEVVAFLAAAIATQSTAAGAAAGGGRGLSAGAVVAVASSGVALVVGVGYLCWAVWLRPSR